MKDPPNPAAAPISPEAEAVIVAARALAALIVQPTNNCNDDETAEMALAVAVDRLDGGSLFGPGRAQQIVDARRELAQGRQDKDVAMRQEDDGALAKAFVRIAAARAELGRLGICPEDPTKDPPNSAEPPISRERRADRYHQRYFVRGETTIFRCLRGATGAVIRTIAPDGHEGLTDPDELEARLIAGEIRSTSCDHGVTFDNASGVVASATEVRRRWPRLHGPCPKGCGFNGIAYASRAHMIAGDW